jgi:glycosyltransferase involved in cell wall biosynthesis
MARGEFVVLLDHDDRLEPDALELVAAALDADPTIDYLYTDEDKLSADGTSTTRSTSPTGRRSGCARRTTAPISRSCVVRS